MHDVGIDERGRLFAVMKYVKGETLADVIDGLKRLNFDMPGIEQAQALIMTHGAETPNSQGLGGGWPGATISLPVGGN